MLTLRHITKNYSAGGDTVRALKGITVSFRKNEFVSILGPSGCGKTTLLNIIGGLDQYSRGNLVINGRSTKEYNDRDWDNYRNHSIGFVFQNYNLIPHQSVLSNVELALTLSGVSKAERRRRAEDALRKVGLADQMHKKPNQMSGGQMQRVAIARALVNDPEILLADEPTGALDSVTSVQIMEILKEISADRLIIMVTHNPELAEQYSSRIIRLLDGEIISDSDPYTDETPDVKRRNHHIRKKTSMSLLTALSLSFNNLLTKKTRTLLVSFAGSIGIIGIALILSVSTGVQAYIDRVQEDTLSSYPITLQAESVDMSSMISAFMEAGDSSKNKHGLDKVYANPVLEKLMDSLANMETNKNNLTDFKKFIDTDTRIKSHSTAIQYGYGLDISIYTENSAGKIVKSDVGELFGSMMLSSMQQSQEQSSQTSAFSGATSQRSSMMSGFNIWEELMPNSDGTGLNPLLKEQYDVIYGTWPKEYNEIVLVVDEKNEISDLVLYALGLRTKEEMLDFSDKTAGFESWSYEDITKMKFKYIIPANFYQKEKDGYFSDLRNTDIGLSYVYNNPDTSIELSIVGIIRENDDAVANMIKGSLCYTSALTSYVIEKAAKTPVVAAQLKDPTFDARNGHKFKEADEGLSDAEKAQKFKDYLATLPTRAKAEMYVEMSSVPTDEYVEKAVAAQLENLSRADIEEMLIKGMSSQMSVDADTLRKYITDMTDAELNKTATQMLRESVKFAYASKTAETLHRLSDKALIERLESTFYTTKEYAAFYDLFMPRLFSDLTCEEALREMGYVDPANPSVINIYASSFDEKEMIADLITEYNRGVKEEDKISYTDYIAIMMSSISTIINAISYVLIAFVAISLVVSSIMIGIITYISVLERTKEIGILRALGASKTDISRVFNAETLIVGFGAGAMGIGVTLLLLLPINAILRSLTGIAILRAQLPVSGAVTLVIISMVLTFIAGVIPSRIAAKKDPVEALRTE